MSADAILALRTALVAAVAADPALAALGVATIHDEPPRAADGIYAVFGDVAAKDWSTGSDLGTEQRPTIVVWSTAGSAKPALAVAARLAALLPEAPLALAGHRLVNLRVEGVDTAREKASQRVRVTLRLRAVTETL